MSLTDILPVSPYPAFYVGRYASQAAEIIRAESQEFETDQSAHKNNDLISTYANSSEVTSSKPSIDFSVSDFSQQAPSKTSSNFWKDGSGFTLDIYA